MVKSALSIEDHNAEEIAKLQRWRLRASIIFFGSIAEMPFSCICPAAINRIFDLNQFGTNVSYAVVLCAVFLPFVGLAGMLLSMFDRRHVARCLALARLADELELRYTRQPEQKKINDLGEFNFINLERVILPATGTNLLQGTFKKRVITAVDYCYNHYYGNKVQNTHQTIVVFQEEFEGLPNVIVVKQWFGEKLEKFITGTPFGKKCEIPGEDEFNEQFTVAGQNRKAVLACLTSEVIDILLSNADLTFLIQDGKLVVARKQVLVAAAAYEDLLITANKVARALERAAETRQ